MKNDPKNTTPKVFFLKKMCVEKKKKKKGSTEKNTQKEEKNDEIKGFSIGFIFLSTFSCDLTWECCRYFEMYRLEEYVVVGRGWFMVLLFGF